jgi:hypothetical protein
MLAGDKAQLPDSRLGPSPIFRPLAVWCCPAPDVAYEKAAAAVAVKDGAETVDFVFHGYPFANVVI